MPNPNKPIWFNDNKKTEANKDTYQTIKTNTVEGDTNVIEINVGGKDGKSPYKIMVWIKFKKLNLTKKTNLLE